MLTSGAQPEPLILGGVTDALGGAGMMLSEDVLGAEGLFVAVVVSVVFVLFAGDVLLLVSPIPVVWFGP